MSFERILCAVDFSPDSLQAFCVAVEMARPHSGSLLVFHVIEAQPAVSPDALIEINKRANDAITELIASAGSALERLTVNAQVTGGRAFDEIVSLTREWKAELVVLGAKGTTSLEEIFVGGTAEVVVKEAPCSVLVVRRQ